MNKRFEVMETLLADSKYFKLVCGAGNENPEEVEKLAFVYTLAGAKGFDVAANPNIVECCVEGINKAFELSKNFDIALQIRPFITVSVGMPGDHHVRKSEIHLDECIKCNLCIPVCPTEAIPGSLVVIKDKCIGVEVVPQFVQNRKRSLINITKGNLRLSCQNVSTLGQSI